MVKTKIIKLLQVYLVCVAALFIIMVGLSLSSHSFIRGSGFPMLAALAIWMIGSLVLLGIFTWIGIGIAVYYDAKQRGMEPLLWALVATLVPYLLGLIAYLIVRHPVQSACPSCGQAITLNDVYCRSCGGPVQAQCPSCGRPSAPAARFCPHCGTPMGDRPAPSAGRPVVL